jgi:hypothetical protein
LSAEHWLMRLLLPLQIPKTPLDETCRLCNNVPIVPFTATPLPFPHGLTDPLRMAMPLKGLGLDGTLIPFFESLTPIKATPLRSIVTLLVRIVMPWLPLTPVRVPVRKYDPGWLIVIG